MSALLISYDLRKPGRNYSGLFEAIKSIGTSHWHCLESVWIVKTVSTGTRVRDLLSHHVDANDKLLVVSLSSDCSTAGLNNECNHWLRENL